MAPLQTGSSSTRPLVHCFQVELEYGIVVVAVVFLEREGEDGEAEFLEKNLRRRDKIQRKTQPTYDV